MEMMDMIERMPSGFPLKPEGSRYTTAWRADCVSYVQQRLAGGVSLCSICDDLGVSDSSVARWFEMMGFERPTKKKEVVRPLNTERRGPKGLPGMAKRCCVTECRREFVSFRADGAWQRMCPTCRVGRV